MYIAVVQYHDLMTYTSKKLLQTIKFGLLAVVALLAATPALSATIPTAVAESDVGKIHHNIISEEWHETHTDRSYCPSKNFLNSPDIEGQKQILNINWIAKNDEDSGLDGYWGLDHFRENLKVGHFQMEHFMQ